MSHKESVISWLNDAYGMEKSAIQVLEHRVKDTEGHPQMQAMIQQHLEESRRHADLVEGCIKQLGGSVSTLKGGMGTLGGAFNAVSTAAASDEMVKNALADHAYEHFEIGCYASLITAAQSIGEPQVANVCAQILQDEQRMASFYEQQIPLITEAYLSQKAREHSA